MRSHSPSAERRLLNAITPELVKESKGEGDLPLSSRVPRFNEATGDPETQLRLRALSGSLPALTPESSLSGNGRDFIARQRALLRDTANPATPEAVRLRKEAVAACLRSLPTGMDRAALLELLTDPAQPGGALLHARDIDGLDTAGDDVLASSASAIAESLRQRESSQRFSI